MTEVSFYHLSSSPLEKALPKLVEKIYSLGSRVTILCENQSLIPVIDDLLWSYSTKTFLAHATCNDPLKEKQPIYITNSEENPSDASILISIGENIPSNYNQFEKYIDIFSSSNDKELVAARVRYKKLKELGKQIKYWKQDQTGNWELTNS
jgi:DNA polymerase-3 subunit chi